jgi:hypothetical protein
MNIKKIPPLHLLLVSIICLHKMQMTPNPFKNNTQKISYRFYQENLVNDKGRTRWQFVDEKNFKSGFIYFILWDIKH